MTSLDTGFQVLISLANFADFSSESQTSAENIFRIIESPIEHRPGTSQRESKLPLVYKVLADDRLNASK